ncbi:helix-turn-helix domain-containing protein [Clostridium sp.]|uniref:helix-turn-helix domain-containing protein n=1 Tax=Clostridium sp. TaxID=1506 RepID=UPI00261A1D68|nr:helix-turn-helix domain-containing protein [Clostridium sp.]
MVKDLLKTMLEINNDINLKPSEKVLLSSLILYHNSKLGYSYPNYEQLQVALSTNRKATVATTIKVLEDKGYITIKKAKGNKNIYYIHKYLFYVGENVIEQPIENPVDSNGKKPLKNQIHIDELINKDIDDQKVIQIADYTGFNRMQSKELLKDSGNDTGKVIKAFDHMKSKKNIENEFKYTKWSILNESKIRVEVKNPYKKASKFDNFEPRKYDYDALEKRLLGWEDEKTKSLADYMIK